MVITVEPGCYFNASLLEPAFKDPAKARYLNPDAISKFMVRLMMVCLKLWKCSAQQYSRSMLPSTCSRSCLHASARAPNQSCWNPVEPCAGFWRRAHRG